MDIDYEIATDILNKYIGKKIKEGCNSGSEEIKKLLQEKEEIQKGNKLVTEKILKQYAKLI